MTEKQAFWMRFYKDGIHTNVAVVADSLDEAFAHVMNHYKVANENIVFRNHILTVLG